MTRLSIALCIAALSTGTASLAEKTAPGATADDVRQLTELFEQVDLDHDRRLTKVEVSVFGRRHNLGVIVNNKGWAVLDANRNGTVTLPEFIDGMIVFRDQRLARKAAR